MEDETAQSEAVSTFCAITGAAPAVAEHYLDSCSWNVERAVDMFFTSPPGEQTNVPDSPGRAANAGMSEEDARAAAAALQDDDLGLDHAQRSEPMHDMGVRAAISVAPAPAGTSAARRAPRARSEANADSDMEVLGDDDDEEEMLRVMAQQRQAGIAAAREAERTMEAMMQDMARVAGLPPGIFPPQLPGMLPGTILPPPFHPAARAAAAQRARGSPPLVIDDSDTELPSIRGHAYGSRQAAGRPRVEEVDEDADAAFARRLMEEEEAAVRRMQERREAAAAAAAANSDQNGGAGHAGGDGEDHEELGVDRHELEEARMIEAAMLGIPYEPRLPTRGTGASGPSAHAPPEVREGRDLRWEQDQAYEESLAADRAKAAAAARAAREAAEAEQRARDEAEAAARAAEEAETKLKALLSRKAATLPAEPAAGDGEAVTIMVRLPDGARVSRKFRKSDPLQAVFDYLDVQHQASTYKPGSYNLVTQFPRKVYEDDTAGSFADVGITSDTALFLESRAS